MSDPIQALPNDVVESSTVRALNEEAMIEASRQNVPVIQPLRSSATDEVESLFSTALHTSPVAENAVPPITATESSAATDHPAHRGSAAEPTWPHPAEAVQSVPFSTMMSVSDSDSASTKVGDIIDDETGIKAINADLQYKFEEEVMDIVKVRSCCHSEVAVLLIDWEPDGEGYLDTENEVQELAEVFEKGYNFAVCKERLKTKGKQPLLHHQMEKFLVNFKHDHDGDDTLLIIYYAGHGLKDALTPGQLRLFGSTTTKSTPSKRAMNYLIWNEAERSIQNTTADLLLIFDCCFAGQLAKRWRGSNLDKIFEFLGATMPEQLAMGPGPNSFTSALIWALKELASHGQGFTMIDLHLKIIEFEHFRDLIQVPCLGERGERTARRKLRIARRLETSAETSEREQTLKGQQPDRAKFYLGLELLFSRYPTEDEITWLVQQFRHLLAEDSEYPLLNVFWRGISLESRWKPNWEDLIQKVIKLRLRKESILSSPNDDSQPSKTRTQDVNMDSPTGAPYISAPNISITTNEPLVAADGANSTVSKIDGDVRLRGKENLIIVANFVQRKSWLLSASFFAFVIALSYMLPIRNEISVWSWLGLLCIYLASVVGALMFGA